MNTIVRAISTYLVVLVLAGCSPATDPLPMPPQAIGGLPQAESPAEAGTQPSGPDLPSTPVEDPAAGGSKRPTRWS